MEAATAKAPAKHTTDADCTLDDTDCCAGCGVYHGDPCDDCGGRGYHAADCEPECDCGSIRNVIDGLCARCREPDQGEAYADHVYFHGEGR